MQLYNDLGGLNGGLGSFNTTPGIQMMGESDGFTLVKGISSYGLKKQRRQAARDDGRFSNMSDFSKTANSHIDQQQTAESRRRGHGRKHSTLGAMGLGQQYADALAAQELTHEGQGSAQMGPAGSGEYDGTTTTLPVLDHHNITRNRHARGQSDQGFIGGGHEDVKDPYFATEG